MESITLILKSKGQKRGTVQNTRPKRVVAGAVLKVKGATTFVRTEVMRKDKTKKTGSRFMIPY